MDRLDDLVRELRASASTDAPAPNTAKSRKPRLKQPALPKVRLTALSGDRRRKFVLAGGLMIAVILTLALLPRPHSTVITPSASPSMAAIDSSTATSAMPSTQGWLEVVQALDQSRGQAFIQRNTAALLNADASASTALTADQAMLRSLIKAKLHVRKFPLHLTSVREEYVSLGERAPRALLTVVDTMGAYDLFGEDGAVVRHIAARGSRAWRVQLVRDAQNRWRYLSAVSAGSK